MSALWWLGVALFVTASWWALAALADKCKRERDKARADTADLRRLAERCICPNQGGTYTRDEALHDLEQWLRDNPTAPDAPAHRGIARRSDDA